MVSYRPIFKVGLWHFGVKQLYCSDTKAAEITVCTVGHCLYCTLLTSALFIAVHCGAVYCIASGSLS